MEYDDFEEENKQVQGEREAFEAWVNPAWSLEKYTDFEGDTVYVEDWVQGAWIGWQARAALSAPPAAGVPKGWSIGRCPQGSFHLLSDDGEHDSLFASWGHKPARTVAAFLEAMLAAAPTPPAAVDRDAIHLAFEHKLREVNLPSYGEHRGDWRRLSREETADVVVELLKSVSVAPPASEQQQAVVLPERQNLNNVGGDGSYVGHGWNLCLDEFLRLNPNIVFKEKE